MLWAVCPTGVAVMASVVLTPAKVETALANAAFVAVDASGVSRIEDRTERAAGNITRHIYKEDYFIG